MAQYLLNATAIWLLSLLCFDMLLSQQSFHRYNRFFLLFTLLMGCLVPLISWPQAGVIYPPALAGPAESIAITRHTFEQAVGATNAYTGDATPWLLLVWLAGMAVRSSLLAADIVKLHRYRCSGTRYMKDGWMVVETGKAHAPFSFRNTLFIQSRRQYTNDEWQMICSHERQHLRLLHLADILLLHVLKIVFWFHPLVYIYHRRLLLVHEYQADITAALYSQQYGRFLIEQSILHAAPSITHGLNNASLNNRLRMMLHKPGKMSQAAMLIMLPLTLICIGCFSKNNAKVEATNKWQLIQTATPMPTEEDKKEMTRQLTLLSKTETQLNAWYISGLQPLLEKLDDGIYQIGPPTAYINKEGRFAPSAIMCIVKVDGITPVSQSGTIKSSGEIMPALRQKIDSKTATLAANCPTFVPLYVNGKPKPYQVRGLYYKISNHKIIASLAS